MTRATTSCACWGLAMTRPAIFYPVYTVWALLVLIAGYRWFAVAFLTVLAATGALDLYLARLRKRLQRLGAGDD
jgi:phosphatidylglycerophosphate synthase